MASPDSPGESTIACVRDGGAYVSTGGTFITNQEHPALHRINGGDRTFPDPNTRSTDSPPVRQGDDGGQCCCIQFLAQHAGNTWAPRTPQPSSFGGPGEI